MLSINVIEEQQKSTEAIMAVADVSHDQLDINNMEEVEINAWK